MTLSTREWLEADGMGGFASGTEALFRTRRYHALLLSATVPPAGRLVLVNAVEAWLEGPGGRHALSTHHYAPDIYYPDGLHRIARFDALPWPTWAFDIPVADTPTGDARVPPAENAGAQTTSGASTTSSPWRVKHEIFVTADSGDVVLRWRWVPPQANGSPASASPPPPGPWRLVVRPLLSVRDYHSLHHRNDAFDFTPRGIAGRITWRPYGDRPAVSVLSNGTYEHSPSWFEQFFYAEEAARGLDAIEDLASPGIFNFAFDPVDTLPCRDGDDGGDGAGHAAIMILRAGDARDVRVVPRARSSAQQATAARPATTHLGTAARLRYAAGAYFAERGRGRTVIAGFPWFTDWGRDTFIALRGLTIATGRLDLAAAILGEWANVVDAGMLPNRFPDSGDTPEYNAVDASLWYVIGVDAYLRTGHASAALQQRLQSAVDQILDGYTRGTRFGIVQDGDGLLRAGLPGYPGMQLTWMDARVGHGDQAVAVTPRVGKPVEIQALWINALRLASNWAPARAQQADAAQASFTARFVHPETAALVDVVDVDHVPGTVDASVRANQIFAVGGLPHRVVDAATARAVVAQVQAELWTPLGLRTLAPSDARYCGRYEGAPAQRDGAYHQGTVWPWLMGPFVEAWLRVQSDRLAPGDPHRDAADRPSRALGDEVRQQFLAALDAHLDEAGLGHISEIADGDAPHTPRGAPFQAWSVAERLRIEAMLEGGPVHAPD